MSNAGQAVSGIVGAVVGFFIGGPQGAVYGFQLGYLAGTALFPTQLPHLQGPRLGDGQQTVSTVGQPIPWIFGTQVVGGNIIWASPIREVATTEDVGGKGGPEQSQTTYSYYRSFAILLCEGPIGGVRRVWANGKILYDARPQLEDEDDNALIERQALNEDFLSKVTIYLGTEDQMPDPTIESFKGVGNVPAYRGYAYVVFNDVQLKPEDGNRIPAQWKFEVYESGENDDVAAEMYSTETIYPWIHQVDPRNELNSHTYRYGVGPVRDSLEAAIADIPFEVVPRIYGWSTGDESVAPVIPWQQVDDGELLSVFVWLNRKDPGSRIFSGTTTQIGADGLNQIYQQMGTGKFWWSGDSGSVQLAHGVWEFVPESQIPDDVDQQFGSLGNPITPDGRVLVGWVDTGIQVTREVTAPADNCGDSNPIPWLPGYCIDDGILQPAGEWTLDNTRTFRMLRSYKQNTSAVLQYPLGPARPDDHPQYDDQEFWENAYAVAVARGDMPGGLVYGEHYPDEQAYGYIKRIDLSTTTTMPVSLASIVSRICDRAGLANYDVSDLEAEYVIGYQVSRPMAARAAIEPLRSVGFFDVVENGVELKFTKRGKATVATLTHDDLGAHFAGEERPSAITTTKALELELPRQIRVHYQNPELDFDPGEELSPTRYDTDAESVTDIDLAVAITPDKAAQIAEVLFRDAWASRWVHLTTVDVSQSELQPADCILVPVDGSLQRMRIANVTERLPNLRQLELMRDDDGAYVSTAEGSSSQRTPPRLEMFGPVEAIFLDIPPLRAEHTSSSIYAAVRPVITSGQFRGATIFRSIDGGATYSPLGSASEGAASGALLQALPSGPTTIFDDGNELLVELAYGHLESSTKQEVINGANAAAIGAHGRWEILQFTNATNIAGRVWRLSGLLRGRRGTEHVIGSSQVGDNFVLLSDGGVMRLPMEIDNINLALLYRVQAVGAPAQSDAVEFMSAGVSLKPFSVVHITGQRNDDGDLTIEWVRRDRLATDTDEAMSESVEDYEVEILGSLGEAIRTISVSSSSTVYTAAQQETDFGNLQPEVHVRIYQMSAAIGRGYPAEATL